MKPGEKANWIEREIRALQQEKNEMYAKLKRTEALVQLLIKFILEDEEP